MPNGSEQLRTPPVYCHYADGACDQVFQGTRSSPGVFLYPSDPATIATTIEAALEMMPTAPGGERWLGWRDFRVAGQVVFCSICKHIRHAGTIVADVTTLNFNLMFEIGFALGLDMPVVLVRDTTFMRDQRDFKELGILDTIGYLDFQNAETLAKSVLSAVPVEAIPTPRAALNRDMPLYLVKSPLSTEGQVRIASIIQKSPLNKVRSYDPLEDPLSLTQFRGHLPRGGYDVQNGIKQWGPSATTAVL